MPSRSAPASASRRISSKVRLDHFDLLAFLLHAAAVGDARFGAVGRDEEIELFGRRGGADEGLEQEAQVADLQAHFFHRLAAHAGVRGLAGIERSGAGFEQAGRGIVHIGAEPELAGQQQLSALRVIGQQHAGVGAAEQVALMLFPAPVGAAQFIVQARKGIFVLRENSLVEVARQRRLSSERMTQGLNCSRRMRSSMEWPGSWSSSIPTE